MNMVVKLYYSDGSEIRIISDKELFEFNFLNNSDFLNYLEDILGYCIETFKFGDGEDAITIDLRKVVCGDVENLKLINNKKVIKFEFLDINSYEYNLAILGMDHPGDLYFRKVLVEKTNFDASWNLVNKNIFRIFGGY